MFSKFCCSPSKSYLSKSDDYHIVISLSTSQYPVKKILKSKMSVNINDYLIFNKLLYFIVTGFMVWALVATLILLSGVSICLYKRRYKKCREYNEIQGHDRPEIDMSAVELYTLTPSPPQTSVLTPESLQESTTDITPKRSPVASHTRSKKRLNF